MFFSKIFKNTSVRLKTQLNQLIDLSVQLIIKRITGILPKYEPVVSIIQLIDLHAEHLKQIIWQIS